MSDHLTVGEVAKVYGVDAWRIRRIVDALDVEIPRAGLYRLIPRAQLAAVAIELQRRGWLPKVEEATSCT